VRVVSVPVTITTAPRFCRWLAVLALALGLVAMHHLVDTPAHPGDAGNSSASMRMLATPVDNCCGTSADVTAGPAQPGPDGGLMLHLCQAILTGLVLLAGLSLAWRPAHAPQPGPPNGGLDERVSRQRAPPTSLRLSYLGVLRL
jgi:hypothetical protein